MTQKITDTSLSISDGGRLKEYWKRHGVNIGGGFVIDAKAVREALKKDQYGKNDPVIKSIKASAKKASKRK